MVNKSFRGGAVLWSGLLALALAGCNAQHTGELSANISAGSNAAPPAATVAADPEPVMLTADGSPLPPVRPDFEKLAQKQQGKAGEAPQAVAASGEKPVETAPSQVASAQTPAATEAQSPQTAAAPQQPTGFLALFTPAPEKPNPAAVAAVSLAAYQEKTTGGDVEAKLLAERKQQEAQGAAPEAAPAQQSLVPQIAPGPVIEVAGVVTQGRAAPLPSLIGPSPRVAAAFGNIGGSRWRPAYDHVTTNCFPADLRRAMDVIGQHFNSEVLVTSGARGNGRRRSLHRSCRAADIRVVGVSPGTVARFAATVPGINGVGTYRRVAVTHIDTRENRMAWRY